MTRELLGWQFASFGWARATIRPGDEPIELPLVSDVLNCPLRDMATAIERACSGAEIVSWQYFHEPSATRAQLSREVGGWTFAVDEIPNFDYRGTAGIGRLIVKGPLDLRNLLNHSILLISRLIDAYGPAGPGGRVWRHELPAVELQNLKRLRAEMTTR